MHSPDRGHELGTRCALERIAAGAGSQRADPRVQDGMRCAITVWDGDKPRRAEFSDVGASGVLRQISELLLR